MAHRFTFEEIGYGYFGDTKGTNKKPYFNSKNYWVNKTDTKGRLSDNEIIQILLQDKIDSLSPESPITERLSKVKRNQKNKEKDRGGKN